ILTLLTAVLLINIIFVSSALNVVAVKENPFSNHMTNCPETNTANLKNENYETIILETKPVYSKLSEKIEISISSEKFDIFMNELESVLQKNISKQKLIENALELFRNHKILPESATLANLKESALNINERFSKRKPSNSLSYPAMNKDGLSIEPEPPFIGLGCSFILATFMNSMAPFAWPPGTIIKLIEEKFEIPFFDTVTPFGIMGTLTFPAFDILVGQSINFGWIHSMIPLNEKIFFQPFYGILIFPIAFSLTIYTETDPPITLFDCIVGASVVGNFIPFQTSWN
ncbi:MAG: hypothetical protein KGY50_01080, partial [Candidatus Thermoplasmatota archaeon]|nr:hypothetical protein [Candidatus Thermoplasmatota archaeon]